MYTTYTEYTLANVNLMYARSTMQLSLFTKWCCYGYDQECV